MYTSRPTKQHEKKGMELMKNLIKSQRKVKTMIFHNQSINIDSQTSIQDLLNKSQQITISKKSQQKQYTSNKKTFKNKDDSIIPEIQNIKQKQQFLVQSLLKVPKKKRQRIFSHNFSFQSLQKPYLKQNGQYKRLSDFHRTLNNSQHDLNYLEISNVNKITKAESSKSPIMISLQQQLSIDRKQSFLGPKKFSISSKNNLSPKILNLKTSKQSRFAKQCKFQEELKKIELILIQQRDKIKITRKQFVDLLQQGKIKLKQFDEDMFEMDIKQTQMETQIQRRLKQDEQRKQKLSSLKEKFEAIHSLVSTQKASFQQQTFALTSQIINTQQENSTITRKIYHIKQQLIKKKQKETQIKKKEQQNKELLRKLIKQQDKVNSLKVAKQMKIIQKRQQMRQKLLQQLEAQDKKAIYDRLDKQLNLIKEYYKISSSSKQFKRNIKKMTKYESFIKSIKIFQCSPQYSEDIMNMYKRQLWDIGMPRFLAQEVMYIQAPQVRKLKNTLKQMDLKRQNLSQVLKQKQRLVTALTFKSSKLGEQIQEMKLEIQRKKQQQEILSEIDWGF